MKQKILFSATMASVLMCSYGAQATSQATDLTTRSYVDDGLSFVYQKAKAVDDKIGTKGNANTLGTGLAGDVGALENAVGAPGVGNTPGTGLYGEVSDLQGDVDDLTSDVNTLQTDVGDLQETVSGLQAASKTYVNGAGIIVTAGDNDEDPSSIGLDLPAGATDGTSYVFQSNGNDGGSWVQLSVTDTWDSTAEARIVGGNQKN